MKLLSTSEVLEVKIGEAVTTTAPTYDIDAAEVVSATLTLITSASTAETGSFTSSYATACAAPGANNQKGITRIHIANVDSVEHTFFLRRNIGGSTFSYFLPGTTLQPGEFAEYEVGQGWTCFDIQGNQK